MPRVCLKQPSGAHVPSTREKGDASPAASVGEMDAEMTHEKADAKVQPLLRQEPKVRSVLVLPPELEEVERPVWMAEL